MSEVVVPAWAEVYRSAVERDVADRALVLRAVGIEHDVVPATQEYVLLVRAADERVARFQIERWQRENAGWPEPDHPADEVGPGAPGTFAYAVTLLVLYRLQLGAQESWVDRGLLDVARVRDGEWWRCVTAMGLHADVVHFAGNLVFGAPFIFGVCQVFGAGFGLLLVLFAGAVANGFECGLYEPWHRSLGASTAVFAALGMLAAVRLRRRATSRKARFRKWVPFVLGCALLGLLGQGDVRTDVLGHVLGMAVGAGCGLALGPTADRWRGSSRLQLGSALAAAGALGTAWWLAQHG